MSCAHHLSQGTNAVERHPYLTDGTIVVEFQLVGIDLPVGTVATELQEHQIVVISALRMEYATMSRTEHTCFSVGGADHILPRCLVWTEWTLTAHLIVVLIAFQRHLSVEVVVDALSFEEDGPLGILLFAGVDGDKRVDGCHVVLEPCHIAESPDGIGCAVIVDEHLGVDGTDTVFFQQTVLYRKAVTLC